jgi:hypothetical protein
MLMMVPAEQPFERVCELSGGAVGWWGRGVIGIDAMARLVT